MEKLIGLKSEGKEFLSLIKWKEKFSHSSNARGHELNKMKYENLLKEIARDFIALGSPIFFIIVIARIYLLSNYSYLSQFVIGAIIFFPLMFLFKANMYSGLGLITLVFISLFYNDLKFTIFGILIYMIAIASLFYLKKDKLEIIKGIAFGAIAIGISYYIVKLIF